MPGWARWARIWRSRRKRPQDLLGVHAALDQLERHPLLEAAVGALGLPDLAHAASAERREQPPGTDQGADRGLRVAGEPALDQGRRDAADGSPEKLTGVGLSVGGEQGGNRSGELGVGGGEIGEPGRARAGIELDQLFEAGAGGGEALGWRRRQGARPCAARSW